ncbi:hypothetical protein AMK68_05630 [candidate division KD3-62 bacterium DG_56]|uniref:Lipoyl-binding domain-containing protein n=1 Tax=candidate division KD3-62 bacterium DG_56 TaxID=1704032 RepID=A0A0S7XIZ5_9BACT|nr:MAG: hypothetical protein AMK68_05630 [candidate division KD3-62 bacterium DG_56]
MDVEQVEALVSLMKEEGIAELTVESPDFKISIKRDLSAAAAGAPAAPGSLHIDSPGAESAAPPVATGPVAVASPAVGRVQLAEGIASGVVVAAGQVVAVVEAMRIPNEVRAAFAGTVLDILVQNGSVVEYGQTLMTIEPSGEMSADETEL